MKTQTFPVAGMACCHCKKHVEDALTRLAGVEAAEASVEQKSVTVTFDETALTPSQLRDAVEAAGYHLSLD